MSRYYRKRKYYRDKQNIRLFIKILLLPITLIILLIKLFNKNTNKKRDNNSNNESLNNTNLGKRYTIIKIIFLIISIILLGLFIYFAYELKNGYVSPIILILSICTITITAIFNKLAIKESNNIENYYYNNYEKYREKTSINSQNVNTKENKYHIKQKTITDNEKYFLDIIKKHFDKDYDIRVQVPLSSIIEKEKEFEGQYQNELNRIIDIGIFDKDTSYPLLLIEINDNTHHRKDRQIRDAKVKNICEQANIKLIAFWTEYTNTEEYVFNRVNENLGR